MYILKMGGAFFCVPGALNTSLWPLLPIRERSVVFQKW
jgi:hypothetical protein